MKFVNDFQHTLILYIVILEEQLNNSSSVNNKHGKLNNE